MEERYLSRIYFVILLLLAGFVMVVFASSFIHALIFAFILGGVIFPYNERLCLKFKIPRFVGGVIICTVLFLAIFLPFFFIILKAWQQSTLLYGKFQHYFTANSATESFDHVVEWVHSILVSFDINISHDRIAAFMNNILTKYSQQIVGYLEDFTASLINFVTQFSIMLLAIVGILMYGYKLKFYVLALFSSEKHQDVQLLIEKFNSMNRNTLVVNVAAGAFQAIFIGFSMVFINFDAIFFWSLMIGFSALIPIVGVMLVCVPLAAYYYFLGNSEGALIFIVVSIVISFIAENFLKTLLMGRGAKINPILMLLSVIGGIAQFGMLGIFYGPLVLGIFITLLEIYKNQTIKS